MLKGVPKKDPALLDLSNTMVVWSSVHPVKVDADTVDVWVSLPGQGLQCCCDGNRPTLKTLIGANWSTPNSHGVLRLSLPPTTLIYYSKTQTGTLR